MENLYFGSSPKINVWYFVGRYIDLEAIEMKYFFLFFIRFVGSDRLPLHTQKFL